ncbi:putative E3 ubiquitin-protein ligase UBR7 [Macrobrachium nipponense]|uniref:putative E3 ubiquitin-protein ligase UBR7 n=1 Tax=Macrobrachium nipponense TaxID=159736 RepID=UPI0030C85F04
MNERMFQEIYWKSLVGFSTSIFHVLLFPGCEKPNNHSFLFIEKKFAKYRLYTFTECVFFQGYVKRQALYACITCCPVDSGRLAGVCLACSYHCHGDHELIELYTKRHFRCDCGNSKFPNNVCKLLKEKLPENPENEYNQNFRGAYCTCHRPYPDPEDTLDDEMIQCCICEDWYHGRHSGTQVPPGDDYAEMICNQCLNKHKFLASYMGLAVTAVKSEETKDAVDIEAPQKTLRYWKRMGKRCVRKRIEKEDSKDDPKIEKDLKKEDSKDNPKIDVSGCKLLSIPKQNIPGAVFLPEHWRKQLCTCDDCKIKYKNEGIMYLLDEEDTVAFYEESGKTRDRSHTAPVQRELEALSSLDRVTRTEMVHEYNTLSSSLREYLRKFAENKKVVRDEDIKEFFSQLAANKKQRPGPRVQQFCK